MEINKVQWRMIAKGEKLPCDSFLMRKDGTIPSVISSAGVTVGQDAYYLPVEELRSFPKEESEDERIRKSIIELLNEVHFTFKYYDINKMLAWLEKQGEQPKKHDVCDYCDQQGSCVSPCPMKLVEKQGEQKSDDKKGMNLNEDEMTPFQKKVFYIIDNTIEEEQGLKQVCDELLRLAHDEIMQESFWSEEDEQAIEDAETWLDTLCDCLKDNSPECISVIKDVISELKSLKARILPQPKQEWSEADEYHKRQILRILKDNGCSQTLQERTEKWIEERLKSLRPQNKTYYWTENEIKLAISDYIRGVESYEKMVEKLRCLKPQSHWKPSNEQISVLEFVMEDIEKDSIRYAVLNSVLEQLKKLKE